MTSKIVNTKLSPKKVITVFSDNKGLTYYLEQRDVIRIGGKISFSAPVPLSHEAMQGIAKSYMDTNKAELTLDGYVPSHLIYGMNQVGKNAVIWYRPAGRRMLNFSESLGIKNAVNTAVPALLFLLLNKDLYVFALDKDERPDLRTRLYYAPFFNIYKDGKVCLGSARVGKKTTTFAGEAERYERGFFMAEQTTIHAEGCKTNLSQLWPRLIKANVDAFPREELKKHSKYTTLGDIINKLISGKNGNTFEEEVEEDDDIEEHTRAQIRITV